MERTGKLMEATKLVVSPRLVAICLAGSFMLVVGAVLSVQYLFLMAGAILSIPAVGYLIAARSLKHLEVDRALPGMVEEGEEFLVTLTVRNKGILPRVGLKLADRLPRGFEQIGPSTGSGPGIDLQARMICGGDSEKLGYAVRARRRGKYCFEIIDAACEDLLGIFHVRSALRSPGEILVYPTAAKVDVSQVLSPCVGEGWYYDQPVASAGTCEVRGVREYQSGDDLRRIHWPTSARVGKLAVTELEDALCLQAAIFLDLHRGISEKALDCAARAARALSDAVLQEGGVVTVVGGSESARAGSVDQSPLIYAALARMQADRQRDLSAHLAADPPPAGVSVVLIGDAKLSRLCASVERLTAGGRPVSAVLTSLEGSSHAEIEMARQELATAGADVTVLTCLRCGVCDQGGSG